MTLQCAGCGKFMSDGSAYWPGSGLHMYCADCAQTPLKTQIASVKKTVSELSPATRRRITTVGGQSF